MQCPSAFLKASNDWENQADYVKYLIPISKKINNRHASDVFGHASDAQL